MMKIMQKRFSPCLWGFVSACLTLLFGAGLFDAPQAGQSALWMALFAFCWWGTARFFSESDRRMQWCFGAAGTLFAVCCALGVRLEACQQTGWDGLALCAGAGLCAGPAVGAIAMAAMRALERLPAGRRVCRRPFLLAFAVLLVCYLPYVIAFFPGITGYDMDFQVNMVRTGNYSSQHPLLHTLFIGLCMKIGSWLFGSVSIGYGIHSALQTVILAASMAYALKWLSQKGCPGVIWWGLLAFFALSPQHGIMAVSGTKDVLFAAGMLVLIVEICRFFTEPERSRKKLVWAADVLVLVCVGMLRKNALYGLAALLVFYAVIRCKAWNKRFLAFILAGMIAAFGGMKGLSAATDAEEGSVVELLCVPCQQLARLHHLYGLDEPVGYEAREVMPYVEDYSPDRADHVKRWARVNNTELLSRFLKLWLREAVHYPIEYIDAFLLNCKGFWYLEDTTFATTYDVAPEWPIGCMVVTNNDSIGVTFMDLFPAFHEWCMNMFRLNGYMNYPVLWMLLHPALYTWLLVFGMAWAAYRRKTGALSAMGVAFSYLLTLLAGPCALIRYQYDLMLCMPVLLSSMSGDAKEEQVHE